MDNITRPIAPIILQTNYKIWGNQFKSLKDRNKLLNKRTKFSWYVHNGQKVNAIILPILQSMTNFHCSFCDKKGLIDMVDEPTIEHFRPSSKFPLLSYFWPNLFLCCYSCQKKRDRYEKALLKPDKVRYSFDEYFIIDWASGKINPKYKPKDPRNFPAKITIELYGLNKGGRPKARLTELKHFRNDPHPDLNEYSYRFFINRA